MFAAITCARFHLTRSGCCDQLCGGEYQKSAEVRVKHEHEELVLTFLGAKFRN